MQLVVFFLMVQIMPVYGDLTEMGGVAGTVTSDSIMGYQENDVTNFLVADGTIQGAVDNANPGDIINLLEKIYRENVHIGKSLQLIGAGIDKTIVDGDTDNDGVGEGRVFYIESGIDVTLADMTIRNGNAYNDPFAKDDPYIPLFGGGILNQGNLTVENCDIHDNAASRGGGILNWAFSEDEIASLTIKGSKIRNNMAEWGGGIYNRAENGTAIAIITGCDIYDNRAEWNHDRCYISGYRYELGGGILNFAQDGTAVTTVKDSHIQNNTAESGYGICSLAASQGTVKSPTAILNVLDSDILGNFGDIYGNSGEGICSIAGHNEAMVGTATAILNVQNSNIGFWIEGISNHAEFSSNATAIVQNSDFHDNYIGIFNDGSISVSNCNIHDNYIGIYNQRNSAWMNSCNIHDNYEAIGNFESGSTNVINCDIHDNDVGINNYRSSMNVQNSNIHKNAGGISNYMGSISIDNCDIYNNNWTGIDGFWSWIEVNNSDIHNNGGNGIDIIQFSSLSINNSDIHDNSISGILSRNSSMNVQNSNIFGNNGRGIENTFGEALINNCNIYDNNGGILNHDGTMTVEYSKIYSNVANEDGGGIYNSGSLTLKDCEITFNEADADKTDDYEGHGGGIFYTDGNDPLLLGYNQIWGNTPDDIYPPMT